MTHKYYIPISPNEEIPPISQNSVDWFKSCIPVPIKLIGYDYITMGVYYPSTKKWSIGDTYVSDQVEYWLKFTEIPKVSNLQHALNDMKAKYQNERAKNRALREELHNLKQQNRTT